MTLGEMVGIAAAASAALLAAVSFVPALRAETVDRMADFVTALLRAISRGLRQSNSDYIDIESNDGEYTFIGKDGSRMTMIRIEGCQTIVDTHEFVSVNDKIAGALKGFMTKGGHYCVITHDDDPEGVERMIREAQAPQRATAQRLEMAMEDLFEEDVRRLKEVCSTERTLICLYTLPTALTKDEMAADVRARQEVLAGNPLPRMANAPALFRMWRATSSRHDAFVDAVVRQCQTAGVRAIKLAVKEAAREMRMSLDPHWTHSDYEPRVIGDKIPLRETRRNPEDVSGYLWPGLDHQLVPRDMEEVSAKVVRIGSRIYQPMDMWLCQNEATAKPFQVFVGAAKASKVPWRATIRIGPKGVAAMQFKSLFNAFIRFTNPENRAVHEAMERVKDWLGRGEMDVRLQMDFCTWAPFDSPRLLDERASRLARAIEAWGGIEVREASGDPRESVVACAPGLRLRSPANVTCALMDDVTRMLPLFRPATAWSSGGILFRSDDGKLLPFQPHSSVQSNWVNVFIAEPRSGKSVLANAINTALCLSPGLVRLPLIGIIDVGRASAGFISLIQNALPASKAHLVQSFRLRMEKGFEINPFDTSLGCHEPLPNESAFVENFLLTLVTAPGRVSADEAMIQLCRDTVQYAYQMYGPHAPQAKRYSRHVLGAEAVDRAMDHIRFNVDQDTTWWEVVRALYVAGRTHEATLAQRFAVPLATDLIEVQSNSPYFGNVYAHASTSSGEPLISAFQRMLLGAINAYPIIGKPTRFDIGEARIVSVDLDDVAKTGSAAADHQSAVCYMLARHVVARNFYAHEDDLAFVPGDYRVYHERRIAEIRQDKKHFMVDEMWRTRGQAGVQAQFERDAREGGKAGVMTSFISQGIEDFPKELLAFATGRFILSPQTEPSAQLMRDSFGATAGTVFAAQNRIKAPGPEGSTVLAIFRTRNDGEVAQLNKLTMGGIRMWAQSTTNEDTFVRDKLYTRLGAVEARRLLAQIYPGGSLLPELERRQRQLGSGATIDSEQTDGMLVAMVEELYQSYLSSRLARAA